MRENPCDYLIKIFKKLAFLKKIFHFLNNMCNQKLIHVIHRKIIRLNLIRNYSFNFSCFPVRNTEHLFGEMKLALEIRVYKQVFCFLAYQKRTIYVRNRQYLFGRESFALFNNKVCPISCEHPLQPF